MNLNKARDYFSGYYEQTLEPGLRQAFERGLQEDAQIQAEYAAFVKTVESIQTLSHQEIEIPFDLHDRISARLDRHVWETEQNRKPNWFSQWWRSIALGGVAVAAIGGVLFSIANPSKGGSTSQAGAFPSVENKKPLLTFESGQLYVNAPAQPGATLKVLRGTAGEPVVSIDLSKNRVRSPLRNEQNEPTLLSVLVGDEAPILVIVPGQTPSTKKAGSGTLLEMAKALSDAYRVPVQLTAKNLESTVTWEFRGETLSDAIMSDLTPKSLSITKQNNMLGVIASAP
ncbi:MAG: hypothetical protein JNM85_01885 [Chthonomonas sp.]|nr:hypothetical protein [Chthonomonas sp.]